MRLVYLRELPEPLFTNDLEVEFSKLMEDIEDEEQRVEKYHELIEQLPEVNQEYESGRVGEAFQRSNSLLSQGRETPPQLFNASICECIDQYDACR